MQRQLFLLVGILLVLAPVFALQVNVTPSPITGTVTKSNPRIDFTAAVTLETNDDAVAVSVVSGNGSVGISGPTYITSSGTYQYTLLFPSTPGNYSGTILFRATGSSNAQYQVSFSVSVTAWEEKYSDFFEKDVMYKVEVGTQSYLMKVKEISSDTITLYFDGAIYTIARGESDIIKENLKIEVDSIFTSGAVLKFYTDGDSVNVSKYSSGDTTSGSIEASDLSGFHFLIFKYSKYVQQNMKFTVSVTLVNDTDYRVYMKDIYFENTTVTKDGEKPTRLEDYQMPSYLDPGQELTLKVTIDTYGLDVGKTYTPSLVALGRVGQQDVRSQVDFYITVVESVQSGKETTEETSQTTSGSSTTSTPKTMTIELVPPNPQPEDIVTIYVRDAKTQDYVNATISVNGEQKSSFTADWCQTYRITATADGYVTANKVVNTNCKTMNVTYTPTEPKEGDTVTFYVTDAETGEPVSDVQIKVDNKPIVGTTWEATAGSHIVVITAPKYSQKTVTIKVEKAPVTVLSSMPTQLKTQEELNIALSREATWEIYDSSGVLVASGTSSLVSFAPTEPGTYTIKVEGKEIGTVEVTKPISLGKYFSGNTVWILAALGVLMVLADVVRKRRKKATAEPIPVGFDLRPKFTTPTPLTEGGEGGTQG